MTISKSTTRKNGTFSQKPLNGRFYNLLNNDCEIDKALSNKWLAIGEIYAETEGFIMAIQDEELVQIYYQRS